MKMFDSFKYNILSTCPFKVQGKEAYVGQINQSLEGTECLILISISLWSSKGVRHEQEVGQSLGVFSAQSEGVV